MHLEKFSWVFLLNWLVSIYYLHLKYEELLLKIQSHLNGIFGRLKKVKAMSRKGTSCQQSAEPITG